MSQPVLCGQSDRQMGTLHFPEGTVLSGQIMPQPGPLRYEAWVPLLRLEGNIMPLLIGLG